MPKQREVKEAREIAGVCARCNVRLTQAKPCQAAGGILNDAALDAPRADKSEIYGSARVNKKYLAPLGCKHQSFLPVSEVHFSISSVVEDGYRPIRGTEPIMHLPQLRARLSFAVFDFERVGPHVPRAYLR